MTTKPTWAELNREACEIVNRVHTLAHSHQVDSKWSPEVYAELAKLYPRLRELFKQADEIGRPHAHQ